LPAPASGHGFFFYYLMENTSKSLNANEADRRSAGRPDEDITKANPGLKEQEASRKETEKGLFNEDPLEEKRAIEETSEDRLSEAE
jgi:hypothetical protein